MSKMKIVYKITDRGGRSYWNRIGVAYVNADGSLNVELEALPTDGRMHIRDYVPRPDFVPPTGGSGHGGSPSHD